MWWNWAWSWGGGGASKLTLNAPLTWPSRAGTWPVANDAPVQFDYLNPAAPVHIQGGIGGVNGQDPFDAPARDWDAFRDLDYHRGYGQFVVHNATHLTFTQYKAANSEVLDTITIVKDAV